ncbi:uncharacterized protein LOC129590018 [Paramacrobiotus metropolitanus]|uniref:uncharacterized protein LOC129590018 n=1 Tax=Paramacrobiotus metropolitanus TaxID=2943436 RepID=UPI002445E0D7|nr:uncharacterized protein LOC129590018 [Paramacrobiotus metropolitanus]
MDIRLYMLLTAGILLMLLQDSASGFALESTTFLEDKCGQTLEIPCPNAASKFKDGYGGQLRFWRIPRDHCKVTITWMKCFPNSNTKLAIYINIRESFIRENDTIRISEGGSLRKVIPGGRLSNASSSAGQLRSTYSSKPTLIFSYKPAPNAAQARTNRDHQVVLDYTIVKDSHTGEHFGDFYYCGSLEGYVHRDLFCQGNRITCPEHFAAIPEATDIATQQKDQDFCTGPPGSRTKPPPEPPATTTSTQPFHTQATPNLTATARVLSEPTSFHIEDHSSTFSLTNETDMATMKTKSGQPTSKDSCLDADSLPLYVDCRGNTLTLNRNVTAGEDPSSVVFTRDSSRLCRQLLADFAELIALRARSKN